MKTQTEKQKIEREIEEDDKLLCKEGLKRSAEAVMLTDLQLEILNRTNLKAKLLGFNLSKECVLEDVEKIIDEMGNFNCGFMDGELCERIDKEKLKQKLEELRK